MINVYSHKLDSAGLTKTEGVEAAIADTGAIWVDLINASADDIVKIEAAAKIDIPTAEERAALEDSARFYLDGTALVMIPSVLLLTADNHPRLDPVAFLLNDGRLFTVRALEAKAFRVAKDRASARIEGAVNGTEVLLALLEGIVERIADLLDEARDSADLVAHDVYAAKDNPDLRPALKTLGAQGRLLAKARDSLSSLLRMVFFLERNGAVCGLDSSKTSALINDIRELSHQSESLSGHLQFLLDSLLGLVSANQNNALRIMSIVSLLLTPPMLIASIYGMNFRFMPELEDVNGYWYALATMLVSVIGLHQLARWRKWF